MSEATDRGFRDAVERRRTWIAGGVLLLLSVAVRLAARGPLAVISPASDWLFAAAGILLAVGLGRAGSVTGRRIMGTTSTILLVVAPLTQPFLFGLVPAGLDPHVTEDAGALIAMGYFGILLILAFVSVLSISFEAVIPSPWRWAPAWVMVWTPLTYLAGLFLFASLPTGPTSSIAASLTLYAPAAGTAFLGVLGIILGVRAGRRATEDSHARPHAETRYQVP